MQEGGVHAQLVGHMYAGVAAGLAAGLARDAAVMCRERPIEVRLPEFALDQAADLLARPDRMCARTGRATGICTRRPRKRTH